MPLKESEINDITREVATLTLPSNSFVKAINSSTVSSTGDPALRIVVFVTPESTAAISGRDALKTFTELQRRLQERNDDRFPIIEYATAKEAKLAGS